MDDVVDTKPTKEVALRVHYKPIGDISDEEEEEKRRQMLKSLENLKKKKVTEHTSD